MDLLCIVCLNAAELGSGEPILLSTVGALSYVLRQLRSKVGSGWRLAELQPESSRVSPEQPSL